MSNHNSICTCHESYTGDPFVQCSPTPGSITPPEPSNPCQPSLCGPNAECSILQSRPVCKCLPGYFGKPPSCRPECVINSECAPTLACINLHCADPCVGVCGMNAKCDVVNHNPICTCPPSFVGDSFTNCQKRPVTKIPTPKPTDLCSPSPCGPYSSCKRLGDRPMCSCKGGYIGSPPNCRPECIVNDECDRKRACSNQHCVNPCAAGACGLIAEYSIRNHLAVCKCPAGFIGDPFQQCSKKPEVIKPTEGPVNPCFQILVAQMLIVRNITIEPPANVSENILEIPTLFATLSASPILIVLLTEYVLISNA